MSDYLLMRLYGPLASWGEIAVGESRHSAMHPSKSALIGLLAAAVGVERSDEAGQQAMAQGYRFGIKLVCAGSPLRDFHTMGVGRPLRKEVFRTRRQELANPEREGTLLSSREYRCDSLAVVALQAQPNAPHSLPSLAQALRTPSFPLYLGRKSCPPALPLAPQIVQAASVREALDQALPQSLLALTDALQPVQPWPNRDDQKAFQPKPQAARYYWEDGMQAGMSASFDTLRHDQPQSRKRWQFAPRREWVHLVGGEAT